MTSVPPLYQRIRHSRIISDEVLDDSFQEAFRRICADLDVKIENQEEKSESVSNKLEGFDSNDDEFDFSDLLSTKSAKRNKNISREESLSAFLRFPEETDSLGLDPSDYAQDFPELNLGFDLYEATFDDPLDVTAGNKRPDEKEQKNDESPNKTQVEADMFEGLVVDFASKDVKKNEELSETFFEIDDKLFDLGEDEPDDEEEQKDRSEEELAKLLTPETQEKFDKHLIDVLLEKNAVNKWQASQLCCGRSTFTLGNYRIVDLLGRGGYGRVFLARPTRNVSNADKSGAKMKDDVAIKVLPFKNAKTLEPIGKFLREVEIAKRLDHRNLVRCYESSKDASVHYCVSEYVDGGDARRLLTEHVKSKGRLHYRIAAYIIAEAAKGLAYMHKEGVIHRDVKPGNILLMKTGEVKLADFGMTTAIKNFSNESNFSSLGEIVEAWENANATTYFRSREAAQTMMLQVQGTPDYLAPDQLLSGGVKNPNPMWDVYSLGCTLYFMLTGVVPYPSDGSLETLRAQMLGSAPPPPAEYDSTLPQDLSRLTMQMLEKDPATRAKYVGSASEVADVLERWVPREMLKNYRFLAKNDNFWSDENLEFFFFQGTKLNGRPGGGYGGRSTRKDARASSRSRSGEREIVPKSNKFDPFSRAEKTASKSRTFVPPSPPPNRALSDKKTPKEIEEEIARLERRNANLVKFALTPLLGLTLLALIAAIIRSFT